MMMRKRLAALALSTVMATGFMTFDIVPVHSNAVSVVEAKTPIQLNQTSLSMGVGKKETLTVKGTSSDISWRSSNPKIATVSSKGVIQARKSGKATIVAKANGKSLKCSVSVSPYAGLDNWSAGSVNAKKLANYVKTVTNPANKSKFIPKADRIAVFDMDGTLLCETSPTYFDTTMFVNFALYDHPERVSEEVKQVARDCEGKTGAEVEALYPTQVLGGYFAKAYAGLTTKEVYDYATVFGRKQLSLFNNMTYGQAFYLPMVEAVKLLYENDFMIYVVSGTERTVTRSIIAHSPIKKYVPPYRVIGTEFEIKVRGHENDPDDSKYQYAIGEDLVYTGNFVRKDVKASKTILIQQEIGKKPVLAFGNSSGDNSMCYYTLSNTAHPTAAFMLVADDPVREQGNEATWAAKQADYAGTGISLVSMKNEFANIYPAGVMPNNK